TGSIYGACSACVTEVAYATDFVAVYGDVCANRVGSGAIDNVGARNNYIVIHILPC
ncbi:MAG: hypothetical protein ACI9ON_003417, partial [Limisphaerales bacterium]